MNELPTGTVTLLFTDIEGSTRLLNLLGKRYSDVLAECRELMRAAFLLRHLNVFTTNQRLLLHAPCWGNRRLPPPGPRDGR